MTRVIALDSETTGLDSEREQVFEIATVDVVTGEEHVWRIRPDDEVVECMHPKAVEVNRFYERVADPTWRWDPPLHSLRRLRTVLAGAHIVGAVPDFDTRFLTATYQRFRMTPPRWQYHLIDVETLAVGYLHGYSAGWQTGSPSTRLELPGVLRTLPWDSDDLSRACGIEPPGEGRRHTALADARWAARLYRRLIGMDGGP